MARRSTYALLSELMWDNAVWVHPQTAQKRHIKTGDEIWLENATGKEKVKAGDAGIRRTRFCLYGIWRKAGAKTAADDTRYPLRKFAAARDESGVSGTVVYRRRR